MTTKQLIRKVSRRPKTSAELGVSTPVLYGLEHAGLVQRVGFKETGRPGRPPILWQATEKALEG
jgi:hypothetical protein